MRIGIFGGTFDPIHVGHLILAEQCREQCQLDEVWFVPAARPPHKLEATISDAKQRTEMLEFAISGNPRFRVSKIELERSGPSFTYLTLEQLKAEDASRELFLLIGADSVRDLPTWRNPEQIIELATVVAVNRGEQPPPDISHLGELTKSVAKPQLLTVTMPAIDISATEIRQRVREGRSIRYQVPRAVEVHIHEQRLYC